MSYQPRNNELVLTLVPDEPGAQPTIGMIVRRASTKDKQEFVDRFSIRLNDGEELEEATRVSWMANPDIWVCLYEDEILMVDQDNIVGPLLNDEEQHETQPFNSPLLESNALV